MVRISDTAIEDESRYWDHRFQRNTIKLLPGDFDVVSGAEMLVTVLGSCVAACIRDTKSGIGGMNHFLLPSMAVNKGRHWDDYDSAATRYGDLAMEYLINKIVQLGGQRENLEAKVFGGARMFKTSFSDIGLQNIEFVNDYLKTERIRVVSSNTGSTFARKIYYIPSTGDVYLKRITHISNNTILERERNYFEEAQKARTTAEVSFF